MRIGTAKVLTLSHPATGRVEVEGATSTTNAVPHAWIRRGLAGVLAALPVPDPPPLRRLLVLDSLAGHRTPEFVCWLFADGVMPLDAPLGGSWLNTAEGT